MSLKLNKLRVKNFRNLDIEAIEFSPAINCILGENGNGKTNILEAIYFLSKKKSFRKNTSFSQLLSMDVDKPEIYIQALLKDNKNTENIISSQIDPKNNIWLVNNVKRKKTFNFKTLFINPFESYIFNNEGQFRRNLFDLLISDFYSEYNTNLKKYQKLIKFKNTLLKTKPQNFEKQISYLNEDIVKISIKIMHSRIKFINELNPYLENIFNEVFSENHGLKIIPKFKFLDLSHEEILEKYEENRQKEYILQYSTIGIHRDDYNVLFDGLNSYEYCSLGQQKMAYLSLLFAYIELFRYKFMSYPVLLIDDVSGELDKVRWKKLIQYLGKKDFQVIITTASENFKLELENANRVKKFVVSSGVIKAEENKSIIENQFQNN